MIAGIHLEGPYIAPARKGTHDASKFRVPDEGEIALAASLDNGVTVLTLAPERVPLETIRALVERGVIRYTDLPEAARKGHPDPGRLKPGGDPVQRIAEGREPFVIAMPAGKDDL